MIGTSTRKRGNEFELNHTEMTFLVNKVEDSWLWHKRIFHINFDNIVKVSTTFFVRDFPKIMKPSNMMCKECVLAK